MSKITESPEFFASAWADTPFNAICVKKKGKTLHELCDDKYGHGIIARPAIERGTVSNDEELRRHLVDELKEPFVIVRGHGWTHEAKFVWSGTTAEFLETWVGD